MASADQVELFLSQSEGENNDGNFHSPPDEHNTVDPDTISFTESQDYDGEPIIEIQATEIESITSTVGENVSTSEGEYVTITTDNDLTFTDQGDVTDQDSNIRVVIHDVADQITEERIEISTPDQELETPIEEQELETQQNTSHDLEISTADQESQESKSVSSVKGISNEELENSKTQDFTSPAEEQIDLPRPTCGSYDTKNQGEEKECKIVNQQDEGQDDGSPDPEELKTKDSGAEIATPKDTSTPSKRQDFSILGRSRTRSKKKIPQIEICATCGKDGDHARLGLVVRRMGHVCESKDEFLMIDCLFRGDFTDIRDVMRICRPCARKLEGIHKFITMCQPNIDEYLKKCGINPNSEKPMPVVTGSPNKRLYRVPATMEWVKRIKVTSENPSTPQRMSTRSNFGQKRSFGNTPVSILPKTASGNNNDVPLGTGKRIKLDREAKRGLEKGIYQEELSSETGEMTIISGSGKELQPVPVQLYKAKHVMSDCAYIPLTALLPNTADLSHQPKQGQGSGSSAKSQASPGSNRELRSDNRPTSQSSGEPGSDDKTIAPVKPSKPASDPVKMKRNAERLILRRSRSLSSEGSSLANKVKEVSQAGKSMLFNSDPSLLMYNYTSGAIILEMESKCPELLEMLCGLTGDKVSLDNRISTISTIYSMIVHCQSKRASAIQKIFPAIQNG